MCLIGGGGGSTYMQYTCDFWQYFVHSGWEPERSQHTTAGMQQQFEPHKQSQQQFRTCTSSQDVIGGAYNPFTVSHADI